MAGVDRWRVEEDVMRRINADDEKECSCGAYSAGECCCDADWTTDELRCLRAENKALLIRVDEFRAENAALQAKIDSLMLEFCPNEMTPEQLAEWAKHQKAVPPEEAKRIDAQIEAALQAPHRPLQACGPEDKAVYDKIAAGFHVPAVPDGWKLVPVEPTPEMYARCDNERLAQIYWRKLLAAAPTQPVDVSRPTDDQLWDQTLSERDHYHEVADKLASAIAEHFSIEIGEHSSANCPWDNALNVIEERTYSDTEALQKDAERYRWLTGEIGCYSPLPYQVLNDFESKKRDVDDAIDAAMKEKT